MKLSLEIDDTSIVATIREILLDRGLIREALERAFAREKLTDALVKAISTKVDTLLASVINGEAFVDTLKLAVADSVEEAVTKTIELVGEERVREMARAANKS